jgi:hypothetical protein
LNQDGFFLPNKICSVLTRGVASLEGDNLVIQMYLTSSIHLKYSLIKGETICRMDFIRGWGYCKAPPKGMSADWFDLITQLAYISGCDI